MNRFRDAITLITILIGAVGLIWFLMIRPYTFEWVSDGETYGTVKTLMSNSNVIGGAYIKAVIILDNGRQALIRIPLNDNIRAGKRVVLTVQTDANNAKRQRYEFKGLATVE